jgi:hypothetical protein
MDSITENGALDSANVGNLLAETLCIYSRKASSSLTKRVEEFNTKRFEISNVRRDNG